MTRKPEITLPAWMLERCGMTRWTLYRALADLERVGLIQTDRGHGKTIRISLVQLPEEET
jgi:DNA-binding GntR family transcriptional regulator